MHMQEHSELVHITEETKTGGEKMERENKTKRFTQCVIFNLRRQNILC